MDVRGTTDRERVAEIVGDDPDRGVLPARRLALAVAGADLPQQAGGEDARTPRPEVLHREVLRRPPRAGSRSRPRSGRRARLRARRGIRTAPRRAGPGSAGRSAPAAGPRSAPAPRGRACRGTRAAPRPPRTDACSLRIVLAPNESLRRAYSSLPTRISADVDQAQHGREHLLARQAAQLEVASDPRAQDPAGRVRTAPSGRTSSRRGRSRQRGWYRYCLRPRASRPVASRWPFGFGQIQTSRPGRRDGERLQLASIAAAVADHRAVRRAVREAAAGAGVV